MAWRGGAGRYSSGDRPLSHSFARASGEGVEVRLSRGEDSDRAIIHRLVRAVTPPGISGRRAGYSSFAFPRRLGNDVRRNYSKTDVPVTVVRVVPVPAAHRTFLASLLNVPPGTRVAIVRPRITTANSLRTGRRLPRDALPAAQEPAYLGDHRGPWLVLARLEPFPLQHQPQVNAHLVQLAISACFSFSSRAGAG